MNTANKYTTSAFTTFPPTFHCNFVAPSHAATNYIYSHYETLTMVHFSLLPHSYNGKYNVRSGQEVTTHQAVCNYN